MDEFDEFLGCRIDNSLLRVYATDVTVSLVPLHGEVFVWNASFKLPMGCPATPRDQARLAKRIASALKKLSFTP